VTTTAHDVQQQLPGARRLVVLDDDPTGTQTVRGVPVLTSWAVDDLRWALGTGAPGFFVLTNTRSLPPAEAEAVNRAVAEGALAAARAEGLDISFASRSDSTLRGHFPLETDTLRQVLHEVGHDVAAVVLAPAYIDAGRLTIRGVHYAADAQGVLHPVAEGEYARDATFGYRSSRLADWVDEKSAGRIPASSVAEVTLDRLTDEPDALATEIASAHDGRVIAVDAATDADLRRAAIGVIAAERAGHHVVQRIGPSYVRARLGQAGDDPVTDDDLAALVPGDAPAHGLVVVGSHVPATTRQLQHLDALGGTLVLELDARIALNPDARPEYVDDLVDRAAAIRDAPLVLRTSRELVRGADEASSLAIATTISAVLVATARRIIERYDPAYVIGKGGITSSHVATEALGLRRAWVRGPLLRGIVSLWMPAGECTAARARPYIVFAGNVGGETALADVVERLERARTTAATHAAEQGERSGRETT
jgi:uncharacterized protein YgbK (DUF1537 family)